MEAGTGYIVFIVPGAAINGLRFIYMKSSSKT